jgi:hypothetical protein
MKARHQGVDCGLELDEDGICSDLWIVAIVKIKILKLEYIKLS